MTRMVSSGTLCDRRLDRVVLGGNRTQNVDFERFRPCEGAHQRAYRCPNRSQLTGLATKGPRGVNVTDIIGQL